jgi:3-oxoacyl-[acyl-carrier-protein] synthase II
VTHPAVVVTGLGAVSAVGWTLEEMWSALLEGRGGLGRLTLFPSERCGGLPVGEVRGDVEARSGLARGSRSDHLAVWAARTALVDAGLDGGVGFEAERAGVVLGALTGGMVFIEACLERLQRDGVAEAGRLEEIACCGSTEAVAGALGLEGPRTTVANACASGATAISVGCDLLETGEADLVLAGGVDSLNRVLLNGFNSLMLVAPDGCRPFDVDRRGMTIGEGAGVLVLELEARARARGARVRAVVAGRGNSCDAHHVTAPHPEGAGLERAMRQALAASGLEPGDVGYVNAHGTGTRDNDVAEARALRALFGGEPPPVSSTKRFFGHTMAAAGALEAIVSILALEHQVLPPNLGLRAVDPEVGFEPVREARPARIEAAMSSSLGFGGQNGVLLLARPSAVPGGAS